MTSKTLGIADLWFNPTLDQRCFECDGEFSRDEAVIRTFALYDGQETPKSRKGLLFSKEEGEIVLYHRHHECLNAKATKYVTISHTWLASVSASQNYVFYECGEEDAYFKPLQLCRLISQHLGPGTEIWHDYISIPQWSYDAKQRILLRIAKIYGDSEVTVVHLTDVAMQDIERMRNGGSVEEQACAATKILNSNWFRRTWTTMECVRSRRLAVLTQDFQFIPDANDFLLREVYGCWRELDRGSKTITYAEESEYSHRPLQLSPVAVIRNLIRESPQVPLGAAFDVIANKAIAIPHDRFIALLGLTKLSIKETELHPGNMEACLQISRRCVEAGDYSALLLAPSPAEMEVPGARWLRCYTINSDATANEAWTFWGLGWELHAALYPLKMDEKLQQPTFQAELVGTVLEAEHFDFNRDEMDAFTDIVERAAQLTGADIDSFVQTVVGSIYGQSVRQARSFMEREQTWEDLQMALSDIILLPTGQRLTPEISESIADILGLRNPARQTGKAYGEYALEHARNHGSVIHLNDRAGLIIVRCRGCKKESLFRAGLYRPIKEMCDIRLYRIPGLEYRQTKRDGLCVLVKDQRIIGRVVYGCHVCPCRIVEDIELL
ncbi:hypothetical protein IWZ01DRAFT_516362 [Phyllosticta capitalensis]